MQLLVALATAAVVAATGVVVTGVVVTAVAPTAVARPSWGWYPVDDGGTVVVYFDSRDQRANE